MPVGEHDYAVLVALGSLKPAVGGLAEAHGLLNAVEHPLGPKLREALQLAAQVQTDLLDECADAS